MIIIHTVLYSGMINNFECLCKACPDNDTYNMSVVEALLCLFFHHRAAFFQREYKPCAGCHMQQNVHVGRHYGCKKRELGFGYGLGLPHVNVAFKHK